LKKLANPNWLQTGFGVDLAEFVRHARHVERIWAAKARPTIANSMGRSATPFSFCPHVDRSSWELGSELATMLD
jgi:hypothetical protein